MTAQFDRVRRACLRAGLVLRVSGTAACPHWMFSDGGGRVLNYWPSNGRVWGPRSDYKGTVPTPDEAVELAQREATRKSKAGPKLRPERPANVQHPPKQKVSSPFVGWVSDEEGELWGEFCGGQTQAECLKALAGHYRRGQVRCFVTRGDNPAVVFDRLTKGAKS